MLCRLMHVFGADLNLDQLSSVSHNSGVETLILICLGHGNIIFESSFNRFPQPVNDSQENVTIALRLTENTDP
jgi:predicted ATPase